MEYCKRCVYPANAKPGMVIDEEGVCSGCRLVESRAKVDWDEREKTLREILKEAQSTQKAKGNPYDCVIPVSGGKDSTYQVYLIKECYGLNPLLVTYNHTFNTPVGVRNLANLVDKFDCNLLRFTSAPGAAVRIARYMLEKVGDLTWHYHAGIQTFPVQAAVQYDVPVVIWGEDGYNETVGMHNLDDFQEFTKKKRRDIGMRGFEPEDLLEDPDCPLSPYDLAPFNYPSDETIEKAGVRGIYLGNYINWNGRAFAEFLIENYDFETAQSKDRSFNIYNKIEDAANGTHDYLKYLKFGYGRATDDASMEIRHGRMTREQGIELVGQFSHIRPSDLDIFLRKAEMTEEEFLSVVEDQRDLAIWEKDNEGQWRTKDSVVNHVDDPGVDDVRLPMKSNQSPFLRTPEKFFPGLSENGKLTDFFIL